MLVLRVLCVQKYIETLVHIVAYRFNVNKLLTTFYFRNFVIIINNFKSTEMKRGINTLLVLSIFGFFASCTKTVMVSDGVNTKRIKVVGNVEVVKDKNNNSSYTKFESVKGTKYNINNSNYTVSVK